LRSRLVCHEQPHQQHRAGDHEPEVHAFGGTLHVRAWAGE
jgi:hypothetical protein